MKKPRVTRTMSGSVVTVKVVDKLTSVMLDKTLALPRYYKNEAKLIEVIQKRIQQTEPNQIVLRVVENVPKKFFCQMLEDEYFDRAEKTEII